MNERKIVTNGDIIKAMFPEIEVSNGNVTKKIYTGIPFGEVIGANIDCLTEWWNAPYRSTPRVKK
jgi:hypothetical protein